MATPAADQIEAVDEVLATTRSIAILSEPAGSPTPDRGGAVSP